MSALRDLVDLYGRGGLEVTTFSETDGAVPAGPACIRTVVQPDADVITWFDPDLDWAAAWRRHQKQLDDKIRSMQRARWILRYAAFLLVAAPAIICNATSRDLLHRILSVVVWFLIGLLLRSLARLALRLYIRRQIEKYLSSLR